MTVLVISLILILCPLSQSVFAGVSEIRKNVLENCPKAISEFNSLTEIDKKSLIPYLELVLGLEAGASVPHVLSPPAIASQQVPFLGRSGRSLGEDLVHSVEPVRELEAKRCAVNLLEKCQVSAFEAVPELIKLSFDKTLPFDFQEQIEDAIWSITLSASRQNVCPAIEAQLENLFRLLTENEDTSLPANVFIQTGDCSVGYVLDILPITDDALSGRCIDILRNIDEAGNIIGPRFLDYLQSKDMALRRMALRVLGTLKAYYPRSVVPILKLLKEGASDLEPELLNTLRAYFREPGLISEHPQRDEISGLLIDLVAALPESERGVIQEGLKQLKSFPPVIRDRLKVMTDAPDATLRKMALMLLGQGADKEDFNLITRKAQSESSVEVEIVAISLLGAQASEVARSLSTFAQILKTSASKSDALVHQRKVCAVGDALLKLKESNSLTPKLSAPLTPYFIQHLFYQDLNNSSLDCRGPKEILSAYPENSLNDLLKLLKTKDSDIQLKALQCLASMPKLEEKAFQPLLQMLFEKDIKVVAKAQTLLSRYGSSAINRLKSAIKTAKANDKIAVAETLIQLGYGGIEVEDALDKAWSQTSCENKAVIYFSFLKLKKVLDVPRRRELISCLSTNSLPQDLSLKIVQSLGQKEESAGQGEEIWAYINKQDGEPILQLAILKQGLQMGISPKDMRVAAEALFGRAEDPVKISLLPVLASLTSESVNIAPLLEKLRIESKNEKIWIQSLIALFSLQIPGYDYKKILLDELKGERRELLETALRHSPASLVLSLLTSLLNEDDALIREWALEVLATIESNNDTEVPALVKFILSPHDLKERFLATLALLKIQPGSEATMIALRKELVGSYREKLLKRRYSEAEKSVFEKITKNPSSFLEQQTAKALLAGGTFP